FEKEYVPSVANQPDFGEFLAIVSTANFSFETRNPNDPIEVSVQFRDKSGRGLFQGSQSFKLVKNPDGSYTSPAEIKVRVWPNSDLPLEVAGADWVEVVLLNEQGETTETRSLDRDQRTGNFLFPLYLAGQKNVLITAFDNREDGTTVKAVYSAQTGTQQPTIITRSVTTSASLEGVIVVKPDSNHVVLNRLDEQVARAFNSGVSPLVQITFTKPQTLSFYAEHPSDGVAKGFWIRQANQTRWMYFQIVSGKLSELGLTTGVYDIIIDWPTFGKREQTFSRDGGGKG
ncbi:MAG: hypothetical protein Q8R17_02225, partial [bacterium]|nr:hypothetical protein [bacterium]